MEEERGAVPTQWKKREVSCRCNGRRERSHADAMEEERGVVSTQRKKREVSCRRNKGRHGNQSVQGPEKFVRAVRAPRDTRHYR